MVTTVYEKLYTKSLILSRDRQQNALNLNATLNFLLCISVKSGVANTCLLPAVEKTPFSFEPSPSILGQLWPL